MIEMNLHISGAAVRLINIWFMTLLMVQQGSIIVPDALQNYSCCQKVSSWGEKNTFLISERTKVNFVDKMDLQPD